MGHDGLVDSCSHQAKGRGDKPIYTAKDMQGSLAKRKPSVTFRVIVTRKGSEGLFRSETWKKRHGNLSVFRSLSPARPPSLPEAPSLAKSGLRQATAAGGAPLPPPPRRRGCAALFTATAQLRQRSGCKTRKGGMLCVVLRLVLLRYKD